MLKKHTADGDSTGTEHHTVHAGHHAGQKVEILGTLHEPGDTLLFHGTRVVVVGRANLTSSSTADVAQGDYAVVYETLAGRKAYRAVVGNELYPIRRWGTAHQLISKQRAPRGSNRKGAKKAAAPTTTDAVLLSRPARDILTEYLHLRGSGDASEIVSTLVIKALDAEVNSLRATSAAIKRLPHDLLAAIANAPAETRARLFDVLNSK